MVDTARLIPTYAAMPTELLEAIYANLDAIVKTSQVEERVLMANELRSLVRKELEGRK